MLRTFLFAAAAAAVFAIAPVRAQGADADTRLKAFFAAEWERGLEQNPEAASYNGDPRFNDRWTDRSLAAIARYEAADRTALEKLHTFDRKALSPDSQLDYDTYDWQLTRGIERQKFREYLQPVSHQGGIQTADGIVEILSFASIKDYRAWLARLHALPVQIEQTTALMREGMRAGQMPPRVLMDRVPGQIASQIVDDPTKSGFYRPFTKFPADVPEPERAALQAEAKRVIADKIIPAYRTFATFFNDEYLPKSRASIAVADLPDGKAYYDYLASYYTTTDLTAEQIHQIGLKEVARIRSEMEKVKSEVGFTGSLTDFFAYLRSDPKFFHKSPAELLQAYRALTKRIDPELVKAFHVIPRQPYGVRPIPDSIAPDTTTAYYQPGAVDSSRAGFYYVNLFKPEVRPTREMLPHSLHEAVPGHHFQFARSLELPDRPMFRRTAYFVAYSEGWGLYAEQLGYDMGLYDDPYDRFGQLTYEMWRAVRLVIDTGMHAKGWSRERAIAYFKDNAAKTEQDIVNEVDRYIGTPGQALAYKIGQIRISALRARAKAALGERFDVRAFNDEVLATGSVPLQALETHIDAWIASEKAKPAGA
jgi:uncharacterized protein (DUF885 family)